MTCWGGDQQDRGLYGWAQLGRSSPSPFTPATTARPGCPLAHLHRVVGIDQGMLGVAHDANRILATLYLLDLSAEHLAEHYDSAIRGRQPFDAAVCYGPLRFPRHVVLVLHVFHGEMHERMQPARRLQKGLW